MLEDYYSQVVYLPFINTFSTTVIPVLALFIFFGSLLIIQFLPPPCKFNDISGELLLVQKAMFIKF